MTLLRIPLGWATALLLVWGWSWCHLFTEWSLNPAYGYGFGVPLLFLILIARRWPGTLEPAPDKHRLWLLLAGAWLILLAGETLRCLDPVWRLPGALLVLSATILSAAFLLCTGGIPLLRREIFPLLFSWLALPWPSQLEQFITGALQQAVITATMTFAETFGIAATQHGSIIELPRAIVGLQEACSGIESFQAALMVTLFLGEFFQLSVARRFALWLGGSFICLSANFARIVALLLIGHSAGQARLDQFHDASGTIASVVNFSLIYVLSQLLRTKTPQTTTSPMGSWRATWILDRSLWLVPAFASIFVFTAATTRLLESGQEIHASARQHWTLHPHQLPPGWKFQPVLEPVGARAILRHNLWEAYDLVSPDGHQLRIAHLFWKPGSVTARNRFVHTPDICMPNAGWVPLHEPQTLTLPVLGQPVTFTAHSFLQEPLGAVTVLQAFGDPSQGEAVALTKTNSNFWPHLKTLWQTSRRQTREELLLYIRNASSDDIDHQALEALSIVTAHQTR